MVPHLAFVQLDGNALLDVNPVAREMAWVFVQDVNLSFMDEFQAQPFIVWVHAQVREGGLNGEAAAYCVPCDWVPVGGPINVTS